MRLHLATSLEQVWPKDKARRVNVSDFESSTGREKVGDMVHGILLVLDMSQPLDDIIRLSSEPLENALGHLGR